MAKIDDVNATIEAEKAEFNSRLAELEAQIVALTAQGTDGATPAQLDALVLKIQGMYVPVAPADPVPPPAGLPNDF